MKIEKNKITKKDFLKLKEEDVIFITNPGRMGDEDGITFIIKDNTEYKIYRIDGLMYGTRDKEYSISLSDISKKFPKWRETWNNSNNEKYKGKYTYLYMGFGNGLSVDNSIYNTYKPYLDKEVNNYLKGKEDKESLQYAAVMNTWEEAFIDMIDNKKKQ